MAKDMIIRKKNKMYVIVPGVHPIMVMATFYCIWPTKHIMIVLHSWFVGLLDAVSQSMVSIHIEFHNIA